MKKSFDYESVPAEYYDEIFERHKGAQSKWHHLKFKKIKKEIPDKSIHLDIGCGAGTFIGMLGKDIASTGIDVSVSKIDYANKKYGNNFNKFMALKQKELPFENNSFNVITIIEVLEHLTPEEAGILLKESFRILKPSGKIIVSTPNYLSLWVVLEFIINHLKDISYEEQHQTHFNDKKLFESITAAGFQSVKIIPYMGLSPFFAFINWTLADFMNKFESNFIYSPLNGFLLLGTGYKTNE